MKKPSLFEIFSVFCYIGIQLIGGGYAIVPLLKKHIVEGKKWMSEDELADFYALSQCIPGIIAGNIAVCAGYKAGKTMGAVTAVSGIILPPFIAIIILADILAEFVSLPAVQNAFWGIRTAVAVLIIITIKELWSKSVNSKFSYILFFIILAMLIVFNISPAFAVLSSAVFSVLWHSALRKLHG